MDANSLGSPAPLKFDLIISVSPEDAGYGESVTSIFDNLVSHLAPHGRIVAELTSDDGGPTSRAANNVIDQYKADAAPYGLRLINVNGLDQGTTSPITKISIMRDAETMTILAQDMERAGLPMADLMARHAGVIKTIIASEHDDVADNWIWSPFPDILAGSFGF